MHPAWPLRNQIKNNLRFLGRFETRFGSASFPFTTEHFTHWLSKVFVLFSFFGLFSLPRHFLEMVKILIFLWKFDFYIFLFGCAGSSLPGRLSLVVASGGYFLVAVWGLLCCRARALGCTALCSCGSMGSAGVAHRLSCSTTCGIVLNQGSNPCLLHLPADSLLLHHQGSLLMLSFVLWSLLLPNSTLSSQICLPIAFILVPSTSSFCPNYFKSFLIRLSISSLILLYDFYNKATE